MADTKISALAAAASALLTHEFPVNEGGVSKKLTLAQIRALVGAQVWVPNQAPTASQSPAANATTYLTGSNIAIPASGLQLESRFRWTFPVTKTAAGTAAKSLLVKLGTTGTTADATILTFALPVGTAVADTGFCRLETVIRGPLGAACVMQGYCDFVHNIGSVAATATTGLINVARLLLLATSAGFNSGTAGLICGLAFTAGVSEAWTIPQLNAESIGL